jgi:hypothetical protein
MAQENEKLTKAEVNEANGALNDDELDAVSGGANEMHSIKDSNEFFKMPNCTIKSVVTQH